MICNKDDKEIEKEPVENNMEKGVDREIEKNIGGEYPSLDETFYPEPPVIHKKLVGPVENDYLVYDVEVANDPQNVEGGWENPEGLGFASAVVYEYVTDRYHFFLSGPARNARVALCEFLHMRTVVSFNGIKFDSRVVLGNDRRLDKNGMTLVGPYQWKNYDLLLEFVKGRFGCLDVAEAEAKLGDKAIHDGTFGIDGLAEGTLGRRKTGHGSKAPVLYREGRYDELFAYNLQDVRLTRALFEYVLKHGILIDRNGDPAVIRRPE